MLKRDLERATAREADAQTKVKKLNERYEDVLRDKVMLAEELSVSTVVISFSPAAHCPDSCLLLVARDLQRSLSKSCSTLPGSWPATTTTAHCSTSAS